MQVDALLDGRQIDDAERPHPVDVGRVVDAGIAHCLAGALDDAPDPALADEHMMRFLGQHEATGARQRVEPGLRQRMQLHLAVAIGEERKHEEGEPVRRRLVEGTEQTRAVAVARLPAQQILGLLAAVAPEIFLQQVDHRPQMAGLLDIDLEQIAQIVERRRGAAEMALLLDRGGLGVALDDDQAAQHRAVFARHFLPGRFPLMRAEADPAVGDGGGEQNAPAVFRHSDIAEFGPALRLDADRGAQIDEIGLESLGAALLPPRDAARVPAFERAAQPRVGVEADIVRNEPVIIDEGRIDHVLLPVFGGIAGLRHSLPI